MAEAKALESLSLKAALETASREVKESPAWLKTIYARNRAIAAAIQVDAPAAPTPTSADSVVVK